MSFPKLSPEELKTLADRDEEIVRLRVEGKASLQQIGDHYGISAERVRQIAAAAGVNGRGAAKSYMSVRHRKNIDKVAEQTSLIMIRWMAGESERRIARTMRVPYEMVHLVVTENQTDEAWRSRNESVAGQVIKFAPYTSEKAGSKPGTHRSYWNAQRCWAVLEGLARMNGGRLGSANWYRELSHGKQMLPSITHIRKRLGKWSYVCAEVNRRVLTGEMTDVA